MNMEQKRKKLSGSRNGELFMYTKGQVVYRTDSGFYLTNLVEKIKFLIYTNLDNARKGL